MVTKRGRRGSWGNKHIEVEERNEEVRGQKTWQGGSFQD